MSASGFRAGSRNREERTRQGRWHRPPKSVLQCIKGYISTTRRWKTCLCQIVAHSENECSFCTVFFFSRRTAATLSARKIRDRLAEHCPTAVDHPVGLGMHCHADCIALAMQLLQGLGKCRREVEIGLNARIQVEVLCRARHLGLDQIRALTLASCDF